MEKSHSHQISALFTKQNLFGRHTTWMTQNTKWLIFDINISAWTNRQLDYNRLKRLNSSRINWNRFQTAIFPAIIVQIIQIICHLKTNKSHHTNHSKFIRHRIAYYKFAFFWDLWSVSSIFEFNFKSQVCYPYVLVVNFSNFEIRIFENSKLV